MIKYQGNKSCSEKSLILGWVHPGEPNGSLILQNLIYNLSKSDNQPQLNLLIIPMINVDGVVCGNYRTGFAGKDLNRLYGKNDVLAVEIQQIIEL